MNQIYPEPTVGALILNTQNKILLVKSHKWINNRYSVPGGHVEIGESLSTAIINFSTFLNFLANEILFLNSGIGSFPLSAILPANMDIITLVFLFILPKI